MSEWPFRDLLSTLKAEEKSGALVFVYQDKDLRRTLVAWTMMRIDRPGDWDSVPRSWDGLWAKVKFDMAQLATHLDTYDAHAWHLFERAKGLRLIYPDGTLHSAAQKLIEELLQQELPKPKRGKTKDSDEDDEA